ncbi:hypothetical protein ABZ383_23265 [Streptomyces sp. NPDC005900]|uniref:hypothetical protein n=1 Tax=Streptomyces sp. NPDC005900 TaxID=3154569 RepID=UPI003403D32E
MSHNQPGPYGQQPPQGQQGWGPPQPPGPYGQQPSSGQQPPYGGAPGGFPPPPQTPKKKTGLIVTGAVLALAVIAGGAYFLLADDGDGDSANNSAVSESTKGYTLVAPESVDDYRKTGPGTTSGELTAEQKSKAEDLGVSNPQGASGIYNAPSTDPDDLTKTGGKRLTFDGLYGDIDNPAEALDNYFAGLDEKSPKGGAKVKGIQLRPVGNPETVRPTGFKGALMKCQDVKVTFDKGASPAGNAAKEYQFPVCAWSDYSTLGGANVFALAQSMTGGKAASQNEVAALTAKLYKTARQKT